MTLLLFGSVVEKMTLHQLSPSAEFMYSGAKALISAKEQSEILGRVDTCSRPGVESGTSCVTGVLFSLLIAGGGCTLPSGLEVASASCPLSLDLERRLRRGGLVLLRDVRELPDLVFGILGICTKKLLSSNYARKFNWSRTDERNLELR